MAALLSEQQAETVVFRSTLPDIDIPDHLPLHDYVFERLAERRDRACIIDGATGETLTLGEVYGLSRRVTAGLRSIGVRHGSTVMLLLPNSVEFALAFLASSRLGAVTTTANPLHTPPEIAKQVAASGATVVVTEPSFVAKARGLAGVTVVATGDGAEGSEGEGTMVDDAAVVGSLLVCGGEETEGPADNECGTRSVRGWGRLNRRSGESTARDIGDGRRKMR